MYHKKVLSVFPWAEFHYLPPALFCPSITGLTFLGFQFLASLSSGSRSSSKVVRSREAAITYKIVFKEFSCLSLIPPVRLTQPLLYLSALEPLGTTCLFPWWIRGFKPDRLWFQKVDLPRVAAAHRPAGLLSHSSNPAATLNLGNRAQNWPLKIPVGEQQQIAKAANKGEEDKQKYKHKDHQLWSNHLVGAPVLRASSSPEELRKDRRLVLRAPDEESKVSYPHQGHYKNSSASSPHTVPWCRAPSCSHTPRAAPAAGSGLRGTEAGRAPRPSGSTTAAAPFACPPRPGEANRPAGLAGAPPHPLRRRPDAQPRPWGDGGTAPAPSRPARPLSAPWGAAGLQPCLGPRCSNRRLPREGEREIWRWGGAGTAKSTCERRVTAVAASLSAMSAHLPHSVIHLLYTQRPLLAVVFLSTWHLISFSATREGAIAPSSYTFPRTPLQDELMAQW